MFKVIFNELAVTIEEFILTERERPEFENVSEQVHYYKTIVDEFYYLKVTLINTMHTLDRDKFDQIYLDMNDLLNDLLEVMEKYKDEFIVTTYIKELENLTKQTTLYDRIYRFEQSLISNPLIKMDIEIIHDILIYAKEFVIGAPKLYFFSNNPFEIDEKYNVVIPKKFEYENPNEFTTALYNYLFGILNTYKSLNVDELSQLDILERTLNEKLFEFGEALRVAKKNKYYPEFGITSDEYVEKVENILNNLKPFITNLVDLGIYRFYSLTEQFKQFELQYKSIEEFYFDNQLYIESKINSTYQIKLNELQDLVRLLEDGKINISKDYIVTDNSIKELVETIIKMAMDNKKTIYYTEKYNKSGMSKDLVFEFYQTSLFLKSIKSYYYELMTKHIYRYNEITIEDYGDGTIIEYRESYKNDLSKYEMFISQEVYFMNEFEIVTYIETVENMQDQLKKTAMLFFDNAMKTSPLTFLETIENQYKLFLDKLVMDLEFIKSKNMDIILLNVDMNREEALTKLRTIEKHVKAVENIIILSKKYVFLDMTSFIKDNIYQTYNEFYLDLKTSFDKEEYIKVIDDYEIFYKTTTFDFNMLHSLEKLAETITIVFGEITSLSTIYIEEQLSNKPAPRNNSSIEFTQDLFDDETYKVLRNELFSQLDNFYEFVISVRENEKPFLMNERNLKKIYFDNQLMKINYIRLYDEILFIETKKENFDMSKLETFEWFKQDKEYITSFDYKRRLDTLILNQNRVLADISKMIVEYSTDNNNLVVDITSDSILSIESYNSLTIGDISEYSERLDKINSMIEYEQLIEEREIILSEHIESWVTMVNGNRIKGPTKVSYNEMETFSGNIPFLVEFEAKVDATNIGDEISELPTFTWDFGGKVEIGDKVSHIFYKEGLQTVRCEMTYESGETSTRFIEFDIAGPTNSQLVKSEQIVYSPIREMLKQPKITYFDEEQNKQITVPITVTGSVMNMVADGNITVSESDQDLLLDRIGMVVLGFDGIEFAGEKFDQDQIFQEEFELPEEAEFLFDFKVSNPLINKSVINISESKFVEYMAKVPKDRASTPYEIEDVSEFQEHTGNTMPMIEGDIIIMKNIMGRYMVMEVMSISEITDIESETFYFEMKFNYYVNISLNQYEKKTFKPLTTSLVVPKIMFKTNVQELFGTLITRLEKLNKLKDDLNLSHDLESKTKLQHDINLLEEENSKFYLFEEYNKLSAKINSFKTMFDTINEFSIDYDESTNEDISMKNTLFLNALSSTKTFYEYMNSINVYDFRKNIIDLEVLTILYQEQKDVMDILIDTYNFKEFDISYFVKKIDKLKFLPKNTTGEYSTGTYLHQLIFVVKNMREYLFKLKLIINFPIMTEGKYIIMNTDFERSFFDSINNEYRVVSEEDFYLLNKKLELEYGFEIAKVEEGAMYQTFISEITDLMKSKYGNGLSSDDIVNLSNYIQVVEDRVVDEYDDFFMIPFWIDYLEKLD